MSKATEAVAQYLR